MTGEVVCVGQALVDCIITGDISTGKANSITLNPGGEALNEAVNISRLGHMVSLVCGLGSDAAGHMLAVEALNSGVDMNLAVISQTDKTPVTLLMVDEHGERQSVQSHAHEVSFFHPDASAFSGAKVITMANLFRAPFTDNGESAEFARKAKEQGAILVADTKLPKGRNASIDELKDVFPYIDYIFPNESEGAYYTGKTEPEDIISVFREAGVKNVLLKRGSRGCVVKTDGEYFHVPAYDVKVVDGIGAGDAFSAGFICGLLERMDVHQCCELATACAAICIGSAGATAGLHNRAQVESFMVSGAKRRERLF